MEGANLSYPFLLKEDLAFYKWDQKSFKQNTEVVVLGLCFSVIIIINHVSEDFFLPLLLKACTQLPLLVLDPEVRGNYPTLVSF